MRIVPCTMRDIAGGVAEVVVDDGREGVVLAMPGNMVFDHPDECAYANRELISRDLVRCGELIGELSEKSRNLARMLLGKIS